MVEKEYLLTKDYKVLEITKDVKEVDGDVVAEISMELWE